MSIQIQEPEIQYVTDSEGKNVSVIVPIDLWQQIQQEIRSEHETAYLLKSASMKQRLLEAKNRSEGLSLEELRARLGV